MAPAAVSDSTTVLADRTRDRSTASDADPYTLAIDRIRAALIRHRINKESLGGVNETYNTTVEGFIDDSYRSQSPVGFTNDAQTIEDIEKILTELESNHKTPHPQLSHDSSKIEEDLLSSGDNGQISAPPVLVEAKWPVQEVSTRTHPQDFAPYDHHINQVAIFENDIMKAFNNSNKAEVKYRTVEVLLLTWEAGADDDIREEVDEDTKALLGLFDEVNYSVTSVKILRDRRKGWVRLQRELSKFVEKYEDYENDDVLFLVHYNGHGSIRNRKSYWHPTGFAARRSDASDPFSEQNGPTIEYDDVRKILDSVVNQDILFVLDCCYAGAASRSKGPGNTKELLAACGSEDRTPVEDSFTSRFVNCFREQLKTDPVFQVGWLFESITDISQKPTPLHVNLNKSPKSICLSSLPRSATDPEGLAVITKGLSNDSLSPGALLAPSSATSDKAMSIFSDDDLSDGITRPTSTQGGGALPYHWNYEVLITVKLHGNVIPDKRGWHIDLPPNQVQGINSVKVRQARIRSIASTKSTLLLVTIPIRCWILLPDNPAYTFIDFVKVDSFVNIPEVGPEPTPLPSPAVRPVDHSNSDNSNRAPDHLPHIIAAIKDFFENKHDTKEKPGPIRRISHKIGLHSSSHHFQNDPRYGYIRHIMQQLVVVRNDSGESHVSYDLHFTEEKKLFERCKKHLIREVLHNAASNNRNELESTVSAELDQLEREVLELVEVDKKRPKIEPRQSSSDSVKLSSKPQSQHKRTSVSQISKHEVIPEDTEVQDCPRMKPHSESGLPRTNSALSMKKMPRTDSMKSRHAIPRTDSRPLLTFLSRKLSRDSARSGTPVQTPMQSPRMSAHFSYPKIQAAV